MASMEELLENAGYEQLVTDLAQRAWAGVMDRVARGESQAETSPILWRTTKDASASASLSHQLPAAGEAGLALHPESYRNGQTRLSRLFKHVETFELEDSEDPAVSGTWQKIEPVNPKNGESDWKDFYLYYGEVTGQEQPMLVEVTHIN